MALVLGLPLQPDDEVLADLPEHEKSKDPLFHVKILRTCSVPGGGFREFAGEVVEIEVGTTTGDRLYRVRYSDGDLQHFTAEEVRACIPPQPNGAVVPAGVARQAAAVARLPERQAAAEEEPIQEAVAAGGAEQEVELGLRPTGELPGLEGDAALDDAEEDLNLIILEEDIEVDPLDALLEDAKAAEEAAAESELIDGYMGVEDPEEEPPAPTPAPTAPARGGPGVQREIVKKGRAKMKAMAKFGGRPTPPVEEEEECEEAT